MKKYLLFIISMLCVSIGAWAVVPEGTTAFGSSGESYYKQEGTVLTLTFMNANDKPTKIENNATVALCNLTSVTKVVVNTGSGITLSGGADSPLAVLNDYYKTVHVLDLSAASINIVETSGGSGIYTIPMADGSTTSFNNVIAPSSYSNGLNTLKVSNRWNYSAYATLNTYQVSGTTVNAVYNTTADKFVSLSSIKSDATKLKIVNEVGAIDLTSVLASGNTLDLTSITTAWNESNAITVASGVKVVCLSDGVKKRVTGTDESNITVANPVISCTAGELNGILTDLKNADIAPTSITITSGELSSTDIESLNIEGLTYLSLENATLAVNINTLTIPSTLQSLTLPKNATPETAIDATLLDKVKAASSLLYVYVPYSGTQNANQTVADYVWVNKAGGLWQAIHNEARLKTAVYVKVASNVAGGVQLNELDAKFGDHSIDASDATNYPWQYIDLSETFFGVAATNAYTAPYTNKGYRIILPDNLTGDNMAIFASKPETDTSDNPDRGYRGKVAAVYSYNGTKLSLLEITDKTYHTDALADSRIVRSGTTEIKVISGSYGGTTFSKFGPNLLAAINAADDTPGDDNSANNHITKVTVAVGDGIYTTEDAKVNSATKFAFDNDNLTNLDLSYTNNSYVTIDVSGCAGLTNFQMNEATVAAVNAYNSTTPLDKLATVSLGHTTVGGDVNLSGTKLTTQLEVDLANITGTLNVSNTQATSFDFTQLTAKSVNASGTTDLTSLNLNGIKLNGMPASGTDAITQTNIDNRIGTVEVTRSGNNYNGLNIITASTAEFAPNRIVPSNGNYTRTAIEPAHIEISAAGSSLSTAVPLAVTAYNTAHASDPGYTEGNEANVQILHVTGELTDADITYIKTNLNALQLLDLSGCTYAAGLSDLVDKIKNAPIPTSTAIVLPGPSNTEEGTITAVKTLQDANYECVAYYTHVAEEENPSDNNSFLNVYAYNGTIGNLISSEPAIVDSYTSITFLRKYKDTDVNSTAHEYPQATPSLLTALSTMSEHLGIPSVDMTWLDISKLGTDFSGLNSHFIIIPQNSTAAEITRDGILYNNDFTVEDDTDNGDTHVSTATYKYYKYHHNTYAISTYKATAAPYATNAYFGGDALSYDNGYGHKNTTATLLYLRDEDNLGGIIEYLPEHMKDAHILSIVGTITNEYDRFMSGLNKMENPCIDLTRATIADISILNSLDNDYVQSISIPYKTVTNLNATPANDEYGLSDLPQLSKTACTNLKGVGMLVKSNDIASGSSKKGRLIYKSYKEGGMANQMLMLHALNQVNREYVISRMVLGGPVNARDISTRTNGIDANGHLATIVTDGKMTAEATELFDGDGGNQIYGSLSGYANIEWWDFSKVTLPTYTSVGEKGWKKKPNTNPTKWENAGNVTYAFSNETHSYGDSGSSFSYQNDLCYTELGLAPSTSLMDEPILPTDPSVWRLVDHALDNCHLLQNICLPWNYQYLGDGALWGTILQHITTTDGSGNLIDNGDNTYTLSANLKELGNNPGSGTKNFVSACVFPQNRPVYDCYALATTTPKCYRGVFPANMYYGWGGFQGAGFPYCREKYKNGSNWFTVLRFPYKAAWEAAHPSPARQTNMEFEEDDDEPMADVQKAPASRRAQQGQVNPDNSYEEMKMAYTDVTKNYTKKEQTGAVDANGEAILWPTFSELRRAYNQASNNVTWNNWKATYDINHDVEQGSGEIPLAASTVDALGTGDHTTTDRGDGNTDGDPYAFQDYEGWHQFVLSQATYVKPGEKQVPIDYREYEKDASWYTFCIPFDMTKEDVIKLMGVPASTDNVKTTTSTFGEHPETETDKYQLTEVLPEIRTMKSVTRTPSTNTVNIYTSQDLGTGTYAKTFYKPAYGVTPEEYNENGTVTIDGAAKDVMIRGGYPYLIKPWKLRGTTISSLGKDIMTRYQFRAEQSSIYHSTADCYDSFGSGDNKTGTFARPYENHKMQAVEDPGGAMNHTDTKHAEKPYNYTYVGQFWKQRLPLHCFYQNSKRLWRHYQNYDERYFWNPYTCIIMVTDEVKSEAEEAANPAVTLKGGEFRDELNCQYPVAAAGFDSEGAYVFDKTLEVYYKNGLDDPFNTASARGYQFFFDEDIMDFDPDGNATAIEVLDGVRIAPIRGKVYNMAGQYVGNSLEGLSKGMYIVNGKKYVIK